MARAAEAKGKLRIGDDWTAIRIIALSQSNPLKAIAELVENSIEAHARKITITRGRERGEHYLAIRDDGDGVPRDANGIEFCLSLTRMGNPSYSGFSFEKWSYLVVLLDYG